MTAKTALDEERRVEEDAKSILRAFDLLATAVLLILPDGRIAGANIAAQALFGRTARALVGTDIAQFVREARRWLAGADQDAKNTEFQPRPTHRTMRAAGQEAGFAVAAAATLERGLLPSVRVRAALSPLPGAARRCCLLELVEIDEALRCDREEVEESVRFANIELLRNLAHEIKNPLGGIRGAAQLLESELEREEDRECTAVILQEAERLQSLVDRLLLPYRKPGKAEPVNIHEVLEQVRNLIGLEFPETVSIERDYDISVPPAAGDANRLTQVFLNLARNAAQAIEGADSPAGRILLRTRVERDAVLVEGRVRTALRVDVADNGPGVPKELREKIFFPLVTGRAEGTGLGLSIVKSFVEEAGGRITLESEPGRTVFSVTLPFYAEGR